VLFARLEITLSKLTEIDYNHKSSLYTVSDGQLTKKLIKL